MPIVKAHGEALVPDYTALEHGVRRYIGRRHDATIGTDAEVFDPDRGEKVRFKTGGWVPTDEPQEVPPLIEYARHIADGDLEAGDDETLAWASSVVGRELRHRDAKPENAPAEPTLAAGSDTSKGDL